MDIALTTRLYSASGYIRLNKNTSVYDISSFAAKIERVEHLNVPLDMVSFSDLDAKLGHGWQDLTSKNLQYIIYDLKRSCEFRLYPIPEIGSYDNISSNSNYGIVTSLNYIEVDMEVTGSYGDINPEDIGDYLKIYYIKSPKLLVGIDDILDVVIDRTTVSALANYISGYAFRDNMDTQNRQVGNEEISLFELKKQNLMGERMTGNVSDKTTSAYRGMG